MKTSLWQKIALVFLGVFLSLVFLEVGMRLGGCVLLSFQGYGNLKSIKQKGSYRILCLGESTTQGQYPHLLEKVLNQRNIGVRFSVIDKGRAAMNTVTLLEEIDSNLAKYHPDMVVTMMGINDWGRHVPLESLTPSGGAPFIRSLKTYKLARLLWLHVLTKAKEMGLLNPPVDRRCSGKLPTSLPAPGLKETFAELVLAEDSLKKAIAFDSKNDRAYLGLGELYRDQGKFLLAEDSYRKVLKINPGNDYAYVGLATIYRDQGKMSQAEDFFKKAIELNPGNDMALVKLGWLYLSQGERQQAEDSYRKAIELNPRNRFALFELGGIRLDQGEFSEAEDLFKKVIAISPTNERILGAMASLYAAMGKPELSKEYAEKTRQSGSEYYAPVTVNNYRKLKEILDRRGVKLVCVQYPMRNIEVLKRIFRNDAGIIFVDNEGVFKGAVRKESYKEYFKDMFAGDFGHCTQKGNELLAQNIADAILKEAFNR